MPEALLVVVQLHSGSPGEKVIYFLNQEHAMSDLGSRVEDAMHLYTLDLKGSEGEEARIVMQLPHLITPLMLQQTRVEETCKYKNTGLVKINMSLVCHPNNLKIYRLDFGKLITLQISNIKLVIIKIPCNQLSIRILYFQKTYEFCVPRYQND